MSAAERVKLPKRKVYTVKSLMRDMMAIEATPTVVQKIGTEVIYFEWTCCREIFGDNHPVTVGLDMLLKFMQEDYERFLLEGELWRTADTPRAAINKFLKTLPPEVLDHELCRESEYIHSVLEAARQERLREIRRCKQIEKGLRAELKQSPDDPDLHNQLRLVLWLLGEYREASQEFKTAKKLGWAPDKSVLVAL
ncbi:MAG: hypothetical protein ACTSPE_11850 [Candidatus Thorarchaeota archaeon]